MQVETKIDLVDWDQFELMLVATDNPAPVVGLFPPKTSLPCIHHRWNPDGATSKQFVERKLRENPQLSLGIVPNPSLPQPSDWGTKPEHLNKRGKPKIWGASNKHIAGSKLIWTEGDGALSIEDQYEIIREAFALEPSFVIWSGGKSLHPYWKLSEPISPEKFKELQIRLAAQMKACSEDFGVDESLNNPARIMRSAGGLHSRTQQRCHFKNITTLIYGIDFIEKFLDPVPQLQKASKPRFLSKRTIADEGWWERQTDEGRHQIAVEMLGYLPKRNVEGRGERKTCISALFALKGWFGESETAQICTEANWFGNFWDPLKELPSLDHPTNSIGTLIELARQAGWSGDQFFKQKWSETQQDKPKIKLEDLFPPEIVQALRTVTKFLPYPDTLIATTYLAGCSGLLKLGSTINLNPLSGFVVPLNLYVITVGCTGSKKSPLQKALIDGPIEKLKKSAKSEYQKILSDWFRADKDSRGPKPTPTYLVVQNVTEEALEMILVDHENKQKGLLYCRDEIKGIFNFDKYKSGKGSEQEQLLELYDGGGFTTIRKQERRICEKTHLSLYGGIQPPILAKLQGSSDHTGKWARVLFSPVPTNPVKLAVAISAEERKAFAAAKEKLSSLASDIRFSSGFQFELDDEAIRFFADYEFEKQKEAKAIASKRASHAAIKNKTAGKVGRIAGLLHHLNVITKRADVEDSVGIDVFEKAIRLVEFSDAFAMQFQTDSGRTENQKWMKRLHTLACKSKSKTMTWTELRDKLSSQEKTTLTPEMRKEAFAQLEEANFGKLKTGPQGGLIYQAIADWPEDV